jgi:hypothetical protein
MTRPRRLSARQNAFAPFSGFQRFRSAFRENRRTRLFVASTTYFRSPCAFVTPEMPSLKVPLAVSTNTWSLEA